MTTLFFIIFGGMLLFFIAYGIWMFHQDKKILDAYKDQTDGRILERCDIPEGEMDYEFRERPFIDCYKSAN